MHTKARERVWGRVGSEVEFLHLSGKVIIVFSYISVEGVGRVRREGKESMFLCI